MPAKIAIVPRTAWTTAPGEMHVDVALEITPRKTPSSAAYARMRTGDGRRLKT
jgi:hypothetical protein